MVSSASSSPFRGLILAAIMSTMTTIVHASTSPASPTFVAKFSGFCIPSSKKMKENSNSRTATTKALYGIRGGEVIEATTLRETEQIISKAALNGKVVVIDFTATWCGPCKQIAPIYEQLSDQFSDLAVFLKVDVDTNAETAAKYGVRAMPTFVLVKQSVEVDRLAGASPPGLKGMVEKHI